jgi:hypothetical protein
MLRFFGEAVVKACVDNGASHIDISGEPQVNFFFLCFLLFLFLSAILSINNLFF